jgi:hypothetical protein
VNIFTTEHPLAAQPSWLETHPWASFVCRVLGGALIGTPLVLVGLYYYFLSDIGAEAAPFPDPWLAHGVAFAFSFVCAFLIVLARRRYAGKKNLPELPALFHVTVRSSRRKWT